MAKRRGGQGWKLDPGKAAALRAAESAARRRVELLAELGLVRRGRERLAATERRAVVELRAQGVSWAEVAAACGISRQAAQQRFGRKSGG